MSEQVKLESATIRTRLIRFGDASLELEAFAYVLTHDAEVFLEIQEELLLRIIDIVEASGTAVALPSETAPAPKNFALGTRARDTVPQKK
jgi:MscS family membrane protein